MVATRGPLYADEPERVEKRLARLDVFRAMRIEASAIGRDGVLPFDLIVEEQAQRRFGIAGHRLWVENVDMRGFLRRRTCHCSAARKRRCAPLPHRRGQLRGVRMVVAALVAHSRLSAARAPVPARFSGPGTAKR